MTAVYKVANRPTDRVLVDYNQNAWGRTLASIYSVRPRKLAPVSTPVTWKEVEKGVEIEDWRMDNVRTRLETRRRSLETPAPEEGQDRPEPLRRLLERRIRFRRAETTL